MKNYKIISFIDQLIYGRGQYHIHEQPIVNVMPGQLIPASMDAFTKLMLD